MFMAKTAKKKTISGAHPGVKMIADYDVGLPAKTGKSPDPTVAQIKPSTKTRIELGFALAKYDSKIPARLIDSGGKEKKDRITHRMEITRVEEIDDEVRKWLKVAYDLDV